MLRSVASHISGTSHGRQRSASNRKSSTASSADVSARWTCAKRSSINPESAG